MNIERITIPSQQGGIPAVTITPTATRGAAVVVHGYGGCKEEQLGLAWRLAESGLMVCAIDMRGHGENKRPFDSGLAVDVEAAIKYCRDYGSVAAIGHSIGGRVALTSTADYAIGISPGLPKVYGRQTQIALRNLRCYRVVGHSLEDLLNTLVTIEEWHPSRSGRAMIVYGSRDLPEIIEACKLARASGGTVREIDQALHTDIYLDERTYAIIAEQLQVWFGK